MGLVLGEAKEFLFLQILGDHGNEMSLLYYIFIFIFTPNVTIATRNKGRRRGDVKHEKISQN